VTEIGATRGPDPVDPSDNPVPAPPLADRTVDAGALQAASGDRTADAAALQAASPGGTRDASALQRPGEHVVDGGDLQQAERPPPA